MSKIKYDLLGLLFSSVLLLTSYYLEYFQGFMPCPLCLLQRYSLMVIAALFLCGILIASVYLLRILSRLMVMIFSLIGLLFAGRQVFLHYFPPSGNECGVSLSFMLQVLSYKETLLKVWQGGPECAQPGYSFLTLNIAQWSAICFALLFIYSVYLLLKRR
jgi:protein dithiol:quinone oxidoreductase